MSSDGGQGIASAAPRLAEADEIEVIVEKLVSGGDGLARWHGFPIFIPLAAPGDRLRVRLSARRPNYARAEIVEVMDPGPDRRDPPCRHFGRCGGCDLQHLEDDAQRDLKFAAAVETLRRLGGVEVAHDVLAGESWGYRMRTQVRTRDGEQTEVGYFARGTHELVAVSECPVLDGDLERAVTRLAGELPDEPPRRIDLAVGDDAVLTTAPVVEGLPHGEVTVEVGEYGYSFDARCFFQSHRGLLGRLVECAVGRDSGEQAVDLYAGVGLFSLPLAEKYGRVTAVEGDGLAARYARRNARLNGRANLLVRHQAIESWIPELEPGLDRVLVDPPRSGLSRPIVAALLERAPKHLTYVSCDPATLARDLKAFSAVLSVERLTLVDLFPQTSHVEAVVQLTGRDAAHPSV